MLGIPDLIATICQHFFIHCQSSTTLWLRQDLENSWQHNNVPLISQARTQVWQFIWQLFVLLNVICQSHNGDISAQVYTLKTGLCQKLDILWPFSFCRIAHRILLIIYQRGSKTQKLKNFFGELISLSYASRVKEQ